MAASARMFVDERDYIGLDITITDNYGVKTRVIRDTIYNNGEDDLYILTNEFKRALVAAGYSSSSVNHIRFFDANDMKKAEAADIVLGTTDS